MKQVLIVALMAVTEVLYVELGADSIQSRLFRSINIFHRLQPLWSTSSNSYSSLFAGIHVTCFPQIARYHDASFSLPRQNCYCQEARPISG